MRVLDWSTSTAPILRPCHYRLLVEDIEVDGFHCESYGAAVTDPAGATARCRHVTVNATHAAQLMELLVRNGVTPVTLADVVEDWLGQ